jgi:hypothetical protein
MSVTDRDDFFNHVLILENSSEAGSAAVSSYFRAQYAIPAANVQSFAMGTNPEVWAYSANRYADFWEPLYEKFQDINGQMILASSHVPLFSGCRTIVGGVDGRFPLPDGLAYLKQIIEDGYDPKSGVGASGSWQPFRGIDGTYPFENSLETNTTTSPYLDRSAPQAWRDGKVAVGSAHDESFQYFFRPVANFDRDYSRFNLIPVGRIGYFLLGGTSFPSWMVDRAYSLISRSIRGRVTLDQARSKPIILGIGSYGAPQYNSRNNPARAAAMYQLLLSRGFTNVEYFYDTFGDPLADYLAPVDGAHFTVDDIEQEGFSKEFWGAFGPAFQNNDFAWYPKFPSQLGGFCYVGASNDDSYTRYFQDVANFSTGIGSRNHNTALGTPVHYDILEMILNGYTMAEATFWAGMTYGYGCAVGDPLYTPIVV